MSELKCVRAVGDKESRVSKLEPMMSGHSTKLCNKVFGSPEINPFQWPNCQLYLSGFFVGMK